MSAQRVLISVVLLAVASAPVSAQNSESCGVRDWFQLRDKVAQGSSSLFCKGAMDAAFEHRTEAERELKEVVRKAPRSDDAFAAHEMLVSLYSRHGQYRKALSQVDQGLLERPGAKDLKDIRSMLVVLAQFPDLRLAHSARSVVQGEIIDESVFAPLTIHGISAKYMLDTDANISALSESEAKRLGLTVHETSTKVSDFTGTPGATKLAEVPDLRIGRIHLKNVAFAVFPKNEWNDGMPNGHKGVLGIPVLLALASLRVEKDNRIVVGSRESAPRDQSIPLAFDHLNPLVQIVFHERPLTFTLDTGADRTYLYKTFADAFPSLMQMGQHRQERTGWFRGSVDLPTLRFSLAHGVDVDLAPATVILNTTDETRWAGTFGFDLLDKALPVTIDFHTMRLSFP